MAAAITKDSWKPTDQFINRVKRAYRASLDSFRPETSDIWSTIPQKQKDIHDALMDKGDLCFLLTHPAKTNLYYGVDNICSDLADTPAEPMAAHVADQIQLLSVSLGTSPLWNPGGGSKYPTKEHPVLAPATDLVDTMSPALDFPNPFEGEIGLATNRGVASYRAVHAIYQAIQLHRLLNGKGRCIEIGAGMGRTAYYAYKLGLTDYTIVDLPLTLVGQASFLAGVLGEDKIALPGEAGDRIKLRPPQWIKSSHEKFAIALNVDSLTEMSLEYAKEYLDFIRENCRAFLSINHEANDFTVRDIASDMRLSRHLYPLRQGYVEEFATLG